ncbi:MAG: type II secretion system protein [Thiobacillus sp.]|uniref:type II secretion system protein n=1 Tax=Thiobacillus sp. TaxID=924 RepID=UPI002895BF04|nr:type II secretion system protein [Thiobacillus sp.]MDT3708220.1 type II secretion system protein [Thiobacillus sp.]
MMSLRRRKSGFTLIELLVVMAIIATLLTLAVPRYFASIEKSKEAVLHANLTLLRQVLDKYYGDKGRYPDALDDLVASKYLRNVPTDPITESNTTWIAVPPEQVELGGVYDVRSGAEGKARDGSAYLDW